MDGILRLLRYILYHHNFVQYLSKGTYVLQTNIRAYYYIPCDGSCNEKSHGIMAGRRKNNHRVKYLVAVVPISVAVSISTIRNTPSILSVFQSAS
jgi:hypothetical protein